MMLLVNERRVVNGRGKSDTIPNMTISANGAETGSKNRPWAKVAL